MDLPRQGVALRWLALFVYIDGVFNNYSDSRVYCPDTIQRPA